MTVKDSEVEWIVTCSGMTMDGLHR
jgi:hypothetical protein